MRSVTDLSTIETERRVLCACKDMLRGDPIFTLIHIYRKNSACKIFRLNHHHRILVVGGEAWAIAAGAWRIKAAREATQFKIKRCIIAG